VAPSRRFDGFDSVDYGVELDTRSGRTFSATWAMDGEHVGLTFRREALSPRWLSARSAVAVWDVTGDTRWAELIARRVDHVRLWWWEQTPPGEPDGCHSVSVRIGERSVHLVLGEERPDGRLGGQDDNVAVVFDEAVARQARVGPWMPADWPGD
jgi:hypothetical protein